VVQIKHSLEPIFDADFQSGSYGYRPKRSAQEAVDRVAQAIAQGLTRIIDAAGAGDQRTMRLARPYR
jgi:RNA-directed DNA polymerase